MLLFHYKCILLGIEQKYKDDVNSQEMFYISRSQNFFIANKEFLMKHDYNYKLKNCLGNGPHKTCIVSKNLRYYFKIYYMFCFNLHFVISRVINHLKKSKNVNIFNSQRNIFHFLLYFAVFMLFL